MFSLLSKSLKLNLPTDITCDLFDSLVTPILLYGCEIWGFDNANTKIIETFHYKFCKQILKVQKRTANCMVLGELGRLKLKRLIDKRIRSFSCNLISGNKSKLSLSMYRLSKKMFDQKIYKPKWIVYLKSIIDKSGFSYIWNLKEKNMNTKWLSAALHLKIDDMAKQDWLSEVNSNGLCLNYHIFKNSFGFEKYLKILDPKDRILLTKFRCGNHRLPINTLRYTNVEAINRQCTLCDLNETGDEFHYIFNCKYFLDDRRKYLKHIYLVRPNTVIMYSLMNVSNKFVICCYYITKILVSYVVVHVIILTYGIS